jgi:hypothetical protein
MDSWPALMEVAIGWRAENGASLLEATLSVEDEEKRVLFSSLEFVEAGKGRDFDIDGRTIVFIVTGKALVR